MRVKVGEVELPQQGCVRYLGVKIDKDLTWKTHIDKVRHQCMAKLAAIRRAGTYLPCHIRKLLYQSFVLPHLDYRSVVWNSFSTTLTKRIERIQNYALRIMYRKPPLTSSESLRQTLGWTTLETRRKECYSTRSFAVLHTNQAPSYLCSRFTPNSGSTMQRLEGQLNCTYGNLELISTIRVLSFKVPRFIIICLRTSEKLYCIVLYCIV